MGNKIDIFKGYTGFGVVDHVTKTVVHVGFDGVAMYWVGDSNPDGAVYQVWKDVTDPVHAKNWPVVTPAQVAGTLFDNGVDPAEVDHIYNLLLQLEKQECEQTI